MSGQPDAMEAPDQSRYFLAGGRIHIAGHAISAAQYRWLFPDLAANLPDGDPAALGHFERAGRHELADRRRIVHEQRMLEIQLQQLSPAAPDAEKSPNFAFRAGTSDTLDIYFSYPLPGDMFIPSLQATECANARLHIKETTHAFFQRGVPGVTTSIEETAEWLGRILAWLRPTRLRMVGASAGAYAAIVFGHLLSADAVVALAPEIVLGNPLYRSHTWFPNARFNEEFRDVTPLIPALRERLALIYPAYDPIEYEMIRLSRAQHPRHMAFLPVFHPGMIALDIGAFARSASALPDFPEYVLRQFNFRYDDAQIVAAARAYEGIAKRDYAASLPILRELYAFDPANLGFLLHIGFQEALLGEREHGLATIRRMLETMRAEQKDPAAGRGSRSHVRSYYDIDRPTIAALERLWDEAAGETV